MVVKRKIKREIVNKKRLLGIIGALLTYGSIGLLSPSAASAQQQVFIQGPDGKMKPVLIYGAEENTGTKTVEKTKYVPVSTASLIQMFTFDANESYAKHNYMSAAKQYGKLLYLENGKNRRTLDRMVNSYIKADQIDVLAEQAKLISQDFPRLPKVNMTKEILDDLYETFFTG